MGLREVTVFYWVVGVVWYADLAFNRVENIRCGGND